MPIGYMGWHTGLLEVSLTRTSIDLPVPIARYDGEAGGPGWFGSWVKLDNVQEEHG